MFAYSDACFWMAKIQMLEYFIFSYMIRLSAFCFFFLSSVVFEALSS
jgi:hypothetical protein